MTDKVNSVTFEHGDNEELLVCLSGDYALEAGLPSVAHVTVAILPNLRAVRIEDRGIGEWDSSLLTLILRIQEKCGEVGVAVDLAGLPRGAIRLIELAMTVPARDGSARGKESSSFLQRAGTCD